METKKRSTFAILFYINRTKVRQDGTCQLLCRVSIDAQAAQIGTKITVDPALWDAKQAKATGRSRNALAVNRGIELLTEKISQHYKQIRTSLGFVTAELVKNALKGIAQKPVTLIKLFEEHNAEFFKRVGVDRKKEAYDIYVLSCKYLSEYIRKQYNSEDVSLRSLNLDFYDGFDLFLRTDRGLSQKTIHQHLYNLKKISRRAFNQGTLRRDPFMKLFPELPRSRSRHTKLEELQAIMQCQPERANLRFIRDLFVFSTFTGLCYADLKRLSDQHIKVKPDGSLWIEMERQKTGTECRVRLMDIPLKIMEKYRPERKNGHIFNVYCRDWHYKLTKELGTQCGIKELTFHKARHNFGTHITLSQGVPIETVSRMMGHKSISTTQKYAKVTDTKVAEDMKRLRERTAAKKVSLHEDETLRAAIRYPGTVKNNNNKRANNR